VENGVIAIVDFGAGNLRSVRRALEAAGAQPIITGDPDQVRAAQAVILPGVGAAGDAIRHLRERGLDRAVRDAAAAGTPLLGVCLGLQLLFDRSEEGDQECLGLLPGVVRRLPAGLKVPHMGWNQVDARIDHPLFAGVPSGCDFYFVHSYYADPADPETVVSQTDYGVRFASVVARDNVMATQFHPEKSGTDGLAIYRNFVGLVGARRDPVPARVTRA
jgi:glutamine amidotransferase